MNHSAPLPCVERSFLEDFFANIFGDIPEASPVLIHSNLAGLGYVDEVSSGNVLCQKYEEIISDGAGERTLLFPTFNYDCLKNGVFDLEADYGQVGLLSTYFARKYPHERTRTPAYNFYIRNNRQRFDLSPNALPFGAGSTMERLVDLDGYILVLGINRLKRVLTIGHYVETLARIGYRYDKEFSVQISRSDGQLIYHKMIIHVRPHGGYVVYREDSDDDLFGKNYSIRGLLAWFIRVKSYVDTELSALKRDEFYWIVPEKKFLLSGLYNKFGRPLRLDQFE